MSSKQWRRLETIEKLCGGRLTTAEAGQILRLSERQVRRVRRRFEKEDNRCVIHKNRGQAPENKTSASLTKKIIELAKEKYREFNDTHLSEKLAESENIVLSRSTLRRILRKAGVATSRPRRAKKHRSRRTREAQSGMLLLWDGSHHDWLEGRGPMMCLMGAIDDATGELMPGAHFLPQETAAGYLKVLAGIVKEKGIPRKIYMDRHGSLKRNDDSWSLEEQLDGKQLPTQVGLALEELSTEAIFALSPQAKGRIERLWGTLQDRLVSEMRLLKISTAEEANAFLKIYIPKFNKRFAKLAAKNESAWQQVPPTMDINEVCGFRYESVVGNDNVVTLGQVKIQIPRPVGGRSFAKARVGVIQMMTGLWRVKHQGKTIAEVQLSNDVAEIKPRPHKRLNARARAFAEGVKEFEIPVERQVPTHKEKKPKPKAPFNYWTKKAKTQAAKQSALRRKARPGPY